MPQDAKITISRTTHSHQEEETISIYIKVGKEQHRLTLTLKDYGLAVSGAGHVPCQYEVNAIGS